MMIIRPEHVSDYAAIGELHACAFGNRSAEAVIVTQLRQRRAFDPELSLVAEINGRVITRPLLSLSDALAWSDDSSGQSCANCR